MKAQEMQTILKFMRLLPDEAINMISDARYTAIPRDALDKTILAFAAGEREWRQECQ
jgi:hypothetical protein